MSRNDPAAGDLLSTADLFRMHAPNEDPYPDGMTSDVAQAGDAELEGIAAKVLSLPGSLSSKLEAIERAAIAETMRSCGHNKSEAARVLGMDRKALERRWHRFQSEPSFPAAPPAPPEPPPPPSQRSESG